MRIAICGSIEFTNEIKEVAGQLSELGHKVDIPPTSQKILSGELIVCSVDFGTYYTEHTV